jgi:2-methylisocitrate lyase-like PEP mutase family enzyme
MEKTTRKLRELLKKDDFLLAVGTWDALGAKLVEKAGFPLVYAGGHVMAASYGYPDVGMVTMTEVVERARTITSAVDLPVICDADTGYGDIINVRRTIREFERAGIAGCHIEDQTFPKKCGSFQGKGIIPKGEMVEKIKAALDARSDPDFFIIARTDAIDIEGLEASIERAKAYEEAGADAIMPQNARGLGLAEMKKFCRQFKKPTVMLITETDYWVRKHAVWGLKEGKEAGFKLGILPLALMYSAVKAMKEVLGEIKEKGTTQDILGKMVDFDELTALVGLPQIYEIEERYK